MPKRPPHHNWITVAVANDFHVPFHDTRAVALFELFLKTEQPDWLILNGDFMDFWEISSFDLTPRPRKPFLKELKTGRELLTSFRDAVPKARITWIEGNHEFRLRKYLMKNAKELYDLTALAIPELFGLKELNIEFVPSHPAATRFTDTFIKVGGVYVGHWNTVAKHGGLAAKGLVEAKGVSLIQGHTHRFGAHARTTVDGRVILGVENFSMCRRQASYIRRPNWQLGFSVLHVPAERQGRAVVSGHDPEGAVCVERTRVLARRGPVHPKGRIEAPDFRKISCPMWYNVCLECASGWSASLKSGVAGFGNFHRLRIGPSIRHTDGNVDSASLPECHPTIWRSESSTTT